VIVYKYVRASIGIQILQKGFIRFTQADALNDPFEIRPCMTEFRAGVIEEGQALLGREPNDFELAKMRRLEDDQFRNPWACFHLDRASAKRRRRSNQERRARAVPTHPPCTHSRRSDETRRSLSY